MIDEGSVIVKIRTVESLEILSFNLDKSKQRNSTQANKPQSAAALLYNRGMQKRQSREVSLSAGKTG
jgi:hypothetical protein